MSATRNLADLAQCFEADRRHLRSVAFGLLGSVADADDAVQSAWLKASRSDFDAVNNLTGWFTTITAREAFDQLRVRKRRAEQPLEDLDRLAPAVSVPADEDALLLLIDGVPGIAVAPRGRAQVLLEIGIGADHRIHSIDITGDADRLHRAILALPDGASQAHRSLIGYQGQRTQSAGRWLTGQDRKHDAR